MRPMSKAEIEKGLLAGRKLIQEEWSSGQELNAVDELIREGVAQASEWSYSDNFQCEVRVVDILPKGEA